MRCPKCNIEINSLSERCPNCGTSAKLAKPDGDAMTRVRKQIAIVCGEKENPTESVLDTSFSPVLKFDKPVEPDSIDENSELNPADNFVEHKFIPVNITEFIDSEGGRLEESDESSEADVKHRIISTQIRQMVNNKEDDLLAEYYFADGISDLERYQLEQSYAEIEKKERELKRLDKSDSEHNSVEVVESADVGNEEESAKELSDSARRLSMFPEESGMDKILTKTGEKFDSAVLKIKKVLDSLIHGKLKRIYDKFDSKTAPLLNNLLDKFYYIKFKGLKRKQEDKPEEKRRIRKIIWSCCAVIIVIAMCTVIFVTSLFTDGVTGQWVVSYDVGGNPNIIMEFTASGKALVSVKSDNGWHVHKQGTYKTQRKNGHDMLTITYEDGTTSRLYYVIDGKEGTFTNVETNVEVVYELK